MKKGIVFIVAVTISCSAFPQKKLTPEMLWQLGRVSPVGMSGDGTKAYYKVTHYDVAANKSTTKSYVIPVSGGSPSEIASGAPMPDKRVSPDGKYILSVKEVKIRKVTGKDYYPDLRESDARIYESLNYRHWDKWEDGAYSHLFLHPYSTGKPEPGKDLMEGEPYDCPQQPFGGEEDFTWSPDGKRILYVAKKKFGTDYALSTNTDIYAYHVANGTTENLTADLPGYDRNPSFARTGALAWLSMQRDGYESDKNDIIVQDGNGRQNLTAHWDGTVEHFLWQEDGAGIWFTAPANGSIQLFSVDYPGLKKKKPVVRQITKGDFDITGIVGQSGEELVVTRTDMNHAAELFTVSLPDGRMKQLTNVNDAIYSQLATSRIEKRFIATTDGKQLLTWVIYPPDFDPQKKYPALLYCQGGPQSALSQFYSFRWNFQLMAAHGYIVIAPSRRGMPGFGVAWNEQVSKDFGGQAMQDYLSATDALMEEPFVDASRIGCVGASYGGYSAYYLAGIHGNRFKTFIAHDGIFNLKSMYGTTEEMWFVNWDFGGAYWEAGNDAASKTYRQFDPSNLVSHWNAPILIIHGARDFRVPLGQGLEAFQAAQLRGIKSKLCVFPEENHWVLTPQNALVWQRVFFDWLNETL